MSPQVVIISNDCFCAIRETLFEHFVGSLKLVQKIGSLLMQERFACFETRVFWPFFWLVVPSRVVHLVLEIFPKILRLFSVLNLGLLGLKIW